MTDLIPEPLDDNERNEILEVIFIRDEHIIFAKCVMPLYSTH